MNPVQEQPVHILHCVYLLPTHHQKCTMKYCIFKFNIFFCYQDTLQNESQTNNLEDTTGKYGNETKYHSLTEQEVKLPYECL